MEFFESKLSTLQYDERKLQLERQAVQHAQKIIAKNPAKPLAATNQSSISIFPTFDKRNATVVTNYIVIGGRDDVADKNILKNLGVSHVLNLTNVVPNSHPDTFIYHNLPLTDAEDVNITKEFIEAASFIYHVEKQKSRVMVHCVAGVSRSVSIVILYLMAIHRWRLKTVYDSIERIRPCMCPNEGFRLQLALFEIKVFGNSTVANNHRNKVGYNKAWDFYAWNNIKNTVTSHPQGGSISSCQDNWVSPRVSPCVTLNSNNQSFQRKSITSIDDNSAVKASLDVSYSMDHSLTYNKRKQSLNNSQVATTYYDSVKAPLPEDSRNRNASGDMSMDSYSKVVNVHQSGHSNNMNTATGSNKRPYPPVGSSHYSDYSNSYVAVGYTGRPSNCCIIS